MTFLDSSISEDEKVLDNNKNNSLYTTIVNDEVKIPLEMISKKETNYIESRAKSRYTMAVPFIKIIVEHYKVLREYERENGSIKYDAEKEAAKFWEELLGND